MRKKVYTIETTTGLFGIYNTFELAMKTLKEHLKEWENVKPLTDDPDETIFWVYSDKQMQQPFERFNIIEREIESEK